jgi:hypothetical protein
MTRRSEIIYWTNGEWLKLYRIDEDIEEAERIRNSVAHVGIIDITTWKPFELEPDSVRLVKALSYLRNRLNAFSEHKIKSNSFCKSNGFNVSLSVDKSNVNEGYEKALENRINYYEGLLKDNEYLQNIQAEAETEEKNENRTTKQNETKPTHSFKYNKPNQLDQLESILTQLKLKGFVKNDVTPSNFKLIFEYKPLTKIKKIDWQISYISLREFIKHFKIEGMTDIKKYEIAACCFTYKGKSIGYNNLKDAKTGNKKIINNICELYPFIK